MPLHNPITDNTPNGWLIGPASNLVLFVGNERVVCSLTQRVLRTADILPGLFTIAGPQIIKQQPDVAEALARMVQYSASDAAFAAEEIKNEFATILSHHAVALWAGVETALEQTILGLIKRVPDAHDLIIEHSPTLNAEKFKTKTANDAEKALSIWEQAIKANSFDRSVEMLRALKVNTNPTSEDRRALVELSEVRNVLLHRGGFVDARFLGKCPWIKLKVGDQFKVDGGRLDTYFDAAGRFASDLIGATVKCPYIYKMPVGSSLEQGS